MTAEEIGLAKKALWAQATLISKQIDAYEDEEHRRVRETLRASCPFEAGDEVVIENGRGRRKKTVVAVYIGINHYGGPIFAPKLKNGQPHTKTRLRDYDYVQFKGKNYERRNGKFVEVNLPSKL
mgnify:CR=1 FL=1